METITEVNYVDKYGKPYVEDESYPAGGGLDARCSYNKECVKAFERGSFDLMEGYLKRKGFKELVSNEYKSVWVKGDTKVVYEGYIDGMYGYMRTEYVNLTDVKDVAIEYMENNDRNLFAGDVSITLKIGNIDVEVESVWLSADENKVYLHCGCREFEGDIDLESLSAENLLNVKDALDRR